MKKILTLAVALVMVFALAAPALAAGWDNPVTPDEFEDLYLNITALSVEESSSVWNGGTYNKLDKTYPVVAGMKVHAYAEIKIPAASELSPDIRDRIAAGQGEITIDISNLTNATLNVRNKDGLVIKKDPISSSKTYPFSSYDLDTTITVEVWGEAKASDKDAKITATLGVYNKWNGTTFDFFSGNKKYTIENPVANTFIVKNPDNNAVEFYTKSDDQVENIKIWEGGNEYYAINNFNGELAFVKSTDMTTQITGDELRDVKAVLDEICGAMGFDYAGRAYINKKLITKNLGTIVEGSASLVYPSGYVQPINPTDPGVNPPQTGDNASVVGFVMIAVALVAAAVVTVKKVRA